MKPKFVKIFLTVLFLGSSMQLLAQGENDTLIANEDYLYKNFALCQIPLEVDTLEEQRKLKEINGSYLIILPPVFETRKDTIQISIQSFYEMSSPLTKDILVYHRYEVVEEYLKPTILNEIPDKNCLSTNPRKCITIDFEKIFARIKLFEKRIEKIDYENGKVDSTIILIYDYYYVSKPAQIIKTLTFNPLDYEGLNNIKMHYLIGNWSEIREFICPFSCRDIYLSEYAQLALREKGYNVRIDGVLDETTQKAIIDFQSKNNLPTGRLDRETLEKLGAYKHRNKIGKKYDGYQYQNSPRFDY